MLDFSVQDQDRNDCDAHGSGTLSSERQINEPGGQMALVEG
jgi:hypothetical protein